MKKLLLFCLLTLFGCSIIPDDAVSNFSEARLKKIVARADWFDDSEIVFTGLVQYTNNKIEIVWEGTPNFHFTHKTLSKTIFELNASGYATRVINLFIDNSEIIDELIYSSDDQVTELKNSFFKDHLKIFYKEGILDSVYKVRTLPNNSTQKGFFKQVTDTDLISIFPFNEGEPYNLDYPQSERSEDGGICQQSISSMSSNEFNKSLLWIYQTSRDAGYCGDKKKDLYYRDDFEGQRKYSASDVCVERNPFGDRANIRPLSSCGNLFTFFDIMPKLYPDSQLLSNLTVESEIKWSNHQSFTDETLFEFIQYFYEPIP